MDIDQALTPARHGRRQHGSKTAEVVFLWVGKEFPQTKPDAANKLREVQPARPRPINPPKKPMISVTQAALRMYGFRYRKNSRSSTNRDISDLPGFPTGADPLEYDGGNAYGR
ncbi:MAG: hypothetical protein ACR2KU_12645 [Gammaproteobacteria bacterium]|nr:hypothetical protein [Gammaproteobacteria bacterium]